MDLDVEYSLRSVERAVQFLEREGQPASAVTISRSFATSIEELWDAVTSSERIPKWFAPVSGDLELGGHYQVEGNAGGTITECELRSNFALTWEFAGDVSWVDVSISGEGAGRARLSLTHTALLSLHWDEYGPGAVGVGWEMGLQGLAIHTEQPTEPMPDEMEFVTSDAGKAFISGSSSDWARAAIAAGTESGVANGAAGRTTAFYTGEAVESS